MRAWTVTDWRSEKPGRFVQVGAMPCPPLILVQDEPIFQAEHPRDYIAKLRAMHAAPETYECGPFHSRIGEFLDTLENEWGEPCATP